MAFRSLVGKLSWPARETVPRLAFEVSNLQQHLGMTEDVPTTAKVEHIKMANVALGKAKDAMKQDESLRFVAIDPKEL